MNQLTEQQAIAFYDSRAWESLDFGQRARFQMAQDRICMPFGVFHEAVEKTLGRPVWTHEFAFRDRLLEELNGGRPAPTMQEILDLIPPEKRIAVLVSGPDREDQADA